MQSEKLTQIKICGITNLIDAKNALNLGANFIGLINVPESPRCIEEDFLNELDRNLEPDEKEKLVLVTKMDSIEKLIELCSKSQIKNLQLYHNFDEEQLSKLKLLGYKLWKPFAVSDTDDIEEIPYISTLYSYVILDTKSKNPKVLGGTGETFDWAVFQKAKKHDKFKFALAGGIAANNIIQAIENCQPDLIDLSSSVESQPGIKSLSKLKELFSKIESAKSLKQGI